MTRYLLKVAVALTIMQSVCFSQSDILIADLGGVQMTSTPVDLGEPGYAATIIRLQADDASKIVTLANISITGQVHQLHGSLSSALTPVGNPFTEQASGLYGEGWSDFDTHLLIDPLDIAGGVWSLRELNDGSNGLGPFPPTTIEGQSSKAGIGSLAFNATSDAFFLVPEAQSNVIDFAYIVTQADGGLIANDAVQLTVGIRGDGIIDFDQPGGAAFGFNDNSIVNVPFTVPEPSTLHLWMVLISILLRQR